MNERTNNGKERMLLEDLKRVTRRSEASAESVFKRRYVDHFGRFSGEIWRRCYGTPMVL